MTLVPLIVRELRCESRRPMNYWLRMGGATIMFFFLIAFMGSSASGSAYGSPSSGWRVFNELDRLLFYGICFLVPMLTADCISGEKRDGTLGLLFLTPLKPIEVTLAKAASQMLKCLTLLVAVLPILMIPMLMGGVSWHQAVKAALDDLSALTMALCCGVLSSALSKAWGKSVFLALGFSLVVFLWARVVRFSSAWTGYAGYPSGFPVPTAPGASEIGGAITSLLTSFLFAGLILWLSARIIAQHWKEQPRSARQEKIHKVFYEPRFLKGLLRRFRQRQLRRNPIFWLFTHSTQSRMTIWLASLAVVVWLCFLPPMYLLTMLNVWMAILVANRFQSALKDGTLQLLLTTPVTQRQIIWGYSMGAWAALAVPAALVYLLQFLPFNFNTGFPYGSFISLLDIISYLVSFLFIPVITMTVSLFVRNPIAAGLLSLLLTTYLPTILYYWLYAIGNVASPMSLSGGFSIFGYLFLSVFSLMAKPVIALISLRVLRRRLKERCVSTA